MWNFVMEVMEVFRCIRRAGSFFQVCCCFNHLRSASEEEKNQLKRDKSGSLWLMWLIFALVPDVFNFIFTVSSFVRELHNHDSPVITNDQSAVPPPPRLRTEYA